MKRITLKGGPRDGRSFDVPHEYTAIAYPGGEYRIKGAIATWKAHDDVKGVSTDVVADDEAQRGDDGGTIPAGKVSVATNGGGKPETSAKPRRARK